MRNGSFRGHSRFSILVYGKPNFANWFFGIESCSRKTLAVDLVLAFVVPALPKLTNAPARPSSIQDAGCWKLNSFEKRSYYCICLLHHDNFGPKVDYCNDLLRNGFVFSQWAGPAIT